MKDMQPFSKLKSGDILSNIGMFLNMSAKKLNVLFISNKEYLLKRPFMLRAYIKREITSESVNLGDENQLLAKIYQNLDLQKWLERVDIDNLSKEEEQKLALAALPFALESGYEQMFINLTNCISKETLWEAIIKTEKLLPCIINNTYGAKTLINYIFSLQPNEIEYQYVQRTIELAKMILDSPKELKNILDSLMENSDKDEWLDPVINLGSMNI